MTRRQAPAAMSSPVPVPRSLLERVLGNTMNMDDGGTRPIRASYREWVRSDGTLQQYVIYEVEPHG